MAIFHCRRVDNVVAIRRDGKPYLADDYLERQDGTIPEFDFGSKSTGAMLLAYAVLREATDAGEALFYTGAFWSGPISRLNPDEAAFSSEGVQSWLVKARENVPYAPIKDVLFRHRFSMSLNLAGGPRKGGPKGGSAT